MSAPHNLESVLALTSLNNRICPLPQQWSHLYNLLPGRRRVGNGWQPSLPLILAAWDDTPDNFKMVRFREHIEWAHTYGVLDLVGTFLASLPEVEWHHLANLRRDAPKRDEVMPGKAHKSCSICGKSFPLQEFSYGQRENRSYCKSCNKEERLAYAKGGAEAARAFREAMRAKWRVE